MIKELTKTMYLLGIAFLILTYSTIAFLCYDIGKKDTYNSFILEECWVNKQSMNIQCDIYEGR